MNTGLQDAYNLAWKLAMVVKDAASERVLDSYEAERMPVARRLVAPPTARSRCWSRKIRSPAYSARASSRRLVAGDAGERVPIRVQDHLADRHPLSHESAVEALPDVPEDAPRAGDRFRGCRCASRRTAQSRTYRAIRRHALQPRDHGPGRAGRRGRRVLVHRVPIGDADNAEALQLAGIAAPAFYLLRPDGHVGLAGARLDVAAMADYLRMYR